MGIHTSTSNYFGHINVSRDKKNCNKVTFRNSLFCLSKPKAGKWWGNESSCPNNRQNFFLQVFVNKKEEAKVLGEGEKRQESACELLIAPSFMVSTWFDGTSIGFRLPRWHQWLKKKKKSPANAGDTRDVGSIPGLGISPGVGNGHRPHNSCLEKMSTHTHTHHEGSSSERNLLHKICMYVYACVFLCWSSDDRPGF